MVNHSKLPCLLCTHEFVSVCQLLCSVTHTHTHTHNVTYTGKRQSMHRIWERDSKLHPPIVSTGCPVCCASSLFRSDFSLINSSAWMAMSLACPWRKDSCVCVHACVCVWSSSLCEIGVTINDDFELYRCLACPFSSSN